MHIWKPFYGRNQILRVVFFIKNKIKMVRDGMEFRSLNCEENHEPRNREARSLQVPYIGVHSSSLLCSEVPCSQEYRFNYVLYFKNKFRNYRNASNE